MCKEAVVWGILCFIFGTSTLAIVHALLGQPWGIAALWACIVIVFCRVGLWAWCRWYQEHPDPLEGQHISLDELRKMAIRDSQRREGGNM